MICTGCVYFNTCGDKDRTEGCEGRAFTPEYLAFEKAVIAALDESDPEELAILERREPRWFEDIMYEINREAHK